MLQIGDEICHWDLQGCLLIIETEAVRQWYFLYRILQNIKGYISNVQVQWNTIVWWKALALQTWHKVAEQATRLDRHQKHKFIFLFPNILIWYVSPGFINMHFTNFVVHINKDTLTVDFFQCVIQFICAFSILMTISLDIIHQLHLPLCTIYRVTISTSLQ